MVESRRQRKEELQELQNNFSCVRLDSVGGVALVVGPRRLPAAGSNAVYAAREIP